MEWDGGKQQRVQEQGKRVVEVVHLGVYTWAHPTWQEFSSSCIRKMNSNI